MYLPETDFNYGSLFDFFTVSVEKFGSTFHYFFPAWGSHWDKSDTPYLTAAAAIGMTQEDIMTFIRRLDKVLASRSKTKQKASNVVQTPIKTPTTVPTINVESNGSAGSPGPKKLTYV